MLSKVDDVVYKALQVGDSRERLPDDLASHIYEIKLFNVIFMSFFNLIKN